MVNTNINPPTQVIDPRFDIPEGLGTFLYPDKPLDENLIAANIISTEDSSLVELPIDVPVTTEAVVGAISSTGLAVPEALTIVSQTVKMSPSGQQLVDVVVQVSDVKGAIQYDLRVTKV